MNRSINKEDETEHLRDCPWSYKRYSSSTFLRSYSLTELTAGISRYRSFGTKWMSWVRLKLNISALRGQGWDRQRDGSKALRVLFFQWNLHYIFFSVFQKVQNCKPRAVSSQSLGAWNTYSIPQTSLWRPWNGGSFVVFPGSLCISGIYWFWFWVETW